MKHARLRANTVVWMRARIILALLETSFLFGCASERSASVVDVPDLGDIVETKYRYHCVGNDHGDFRRWLEGGSEGKCEVDNNQLARYQPKVFANDGIPIILCKCSRQELDRWGYSELAKFGWFVFYMSTAGLLPFAPRGYEIDQRFLVRIADEESSARYIDIRERHDEIASALTPTAWLFYHGTPKFEGVENCKVFSKTKCGVGMQSGYYTGNEALAYGMAVKLKALEDAGQITDAVRQRGALLCRQRQQAKRDAFVRKATRQPSGMIAKQSSRSSASQRATTNIQQHSLAVGQESAYTLEKFVWESDKDYMCAFTVRMNGVCTIENFFAIEQKFRMYIRNAYIQAHPSIDARFLVVEVRPALADGRIVGRAAVLTIAPVSHSYEAVTRRGKLSVRFNPGQYDEAREWTRKNIETLARDKNIVLETDTMPPPGRYRLLGETVKDGNILEIEFKTE